jgi:hypothetical protein
MSAANDRDVQARRHRRIAKRLNAIKDSVEEISDAVEEIRDAIKLRYGGVNVSGGFVLYVLIGIGWGIGVAPPDATSFRS